MGIGAAGAVMEVGRDAGASWGMPFSALTASPLRACPESLSFSPICSGLLLFSLWSSSFSLGGLLSLGLRALQKNLFQWVPDGLCHSFEQCYR